MATGRRHWRFIVRDRYGFAIQNAAVNVYQPGTTNPPLGTMYDAYTGGSSVTNPLHTNSQGEVEAFFDTSQAIDVNVTDNGDTAYRATTGSGSPISFSAFTERDEPQYLPTDIFTQDNFTAGYVVGVVGDITTITTASQTGLAGAVGKYADAGHRHPHTDTWAIDPHGVATHSDVTRTIFLPINDGVVLDGGTLASVGTLPDTIRSITLADAATSGALWAFSLTDWASGAISVSPLFTPVSGAMNGNTRWTLTTKAVASGSLTAAGTAVSFTQTGASEATGVLIRATLTSTTVTPAAGSDVIMLSVRRIGADGADTATVTVGLVGVIVSYTATQ